ncbi:MAG: carbohydrate ABC transporter permease [Micromonosporaceae bacterium]
MPDPEPEAQPEPEPAARRATRPRWQSLLLHGGLLLAAVVMTYPLLWLLGSSLKPSEEIFGSQSLIPGSPTLENYTAGWSANEVSFGWFLVNSLLVCAGACIGNVVSCSLAAYAFARINFRFRKLWFALMLGTVMLPAHVTLVPQYFVFYNVGWVDTYLPLVVPKFLAVDAFFIFLLVQFIRSLPTELDEAAELDGCGRFATFTKVILPLMRPALATTAVFTFIWTYEDFLTPLIYLSDTGTYTVPLGLRLFLNGLGQQSYGQLFAMSMLSLVPVLGFFVLFQRRLLDGIATTGLKG